MTGQATVVAKKWWWLSFVDPERPAGKRWAGACIVEGYDLISACQEAYKQGCNPGGEVLGIDFKPGYTPVEGFANRLLTEDEARNYVV